MIEILKQKFEGKVDARLGNDKNLPIENDSAEYAFANMYLHHVENPEVAIKEMTRIVKKGGRVVISDLDEHNFEFLRTDQNYRWLGFKREDVKQWFELAGLHSVTIDCADESCCADSKCGCSSAKISVFIACGEM